MIISKSNNWGEWVEEYVAIRMRYSPIEMWDEYEFEKDIQDIGGWCAYPKNDPLERIVICLRKADLEEKKIKILELAKKQQVNPEFDGLGITITRRRDLNGKPGYDFNYKIIIEGEIINSQITE